MIAADAREFRGLCARIGAGSDLQWPIGYSRAVERDGRRWILAANGPGPRLATRAFEAAASRVRFRAVLNTGYCGALDPELRAGEVVAADLIIDGDTGERFGASVPDGASELRRGAIVTGDRVISTASMKAELRRTTGARFADMEASAVAKASQARSLPFHCIRVVSDTAEEGFDTDLNAARDAEGRFELMSILAQAARKPWTRIPELIHFDRQTKMASEMLGEFLAGCRL